MAQCIAAKADGTQCRMLAKPEFDGTPGEGLCGRHQRQLVEADTPVRRADTGLELYKPGRKADSR